MSLLSSAVRKEYERGRLLEADIPADPMALFAAWLGEAVDAALWEPNAMTLATADAQARPSARVVLLKGFDARGFAFFTNYQSRKADDLAVNPWAALTFWWGPLERQVRIEGAAEKLPAAESDAYYASRPLGSRLGAHVSRQSQVIASRDLLEARLAALEAEYADGAEPQRPAWWGGYLVIPQTMEFWQGGPHRLHDRLCYRRDAAAAQEPPAWRLERLSP
jgi:pyridoxamine 5'-phosphate oxidase